MKYSFKFKRFGSKVQMYSENEMGVVIEKERHVVCVYGTDCTHKNILCSIPLCHPRYLKNAEYVVDFRPTGIVKINVLDIQIVIDFKEHKCKNSLNLPCHGSSTWGQDVQVKWSKKDF